VEWLTIPVLTYFESLPENITMLKQQIALLPQFIVAGSWEQQQ
jgi:hypothetical protein